MAFTIGKKRAAKQERLDSVLTGKTPAQAAQYIENNVTDLASAKAALKVAFALIVAMNAKIKERG